MKVTVFGSGYVGLVTGVCLAEVGNDVECIDVDQQKIDNLKKALFPFRNLGWTSWLKRMALCGIEWVDIAEPFGLAQ